MIRKNKPAMCIKLGYFNSENCFLSMITNRMKNKINQAKNLDPQKVSFKISIFHKIELNTSEKILKYADAWKMPPIPIKPQITKMLPLPNQ